MMKINDYIIAAVTLMLYMGFWGFGVMVEIHLLAVS